MSSSSQRVICSRLPNTTPWPSWSLKAYSNLSVYAGCEVAGGYASGMSSIVTKGLPDDSDDRMPAGETSVTIAPELMGKVFGSETEDATTSSWCSTTSEESTQNMSDTSDMTGMIGILMKGPGLPVL